MDFGRAKYSISAKKNASDQKKVRRNRVKDFPDKQTRRLESIANHPEAGDKPLAFDPGQPKRDNRRSKPALASRFVQGRT